MTPRWVFLDVGNVLLDEDPLTYLSFRRHADAVRRARPDVGFAELLARREALASAGSRWPVYEAVVPYLGEAGCEALWAEVAREVRARFDELSPPVRGAAGLVARLASRYRLGLIANQGGECRRRLERLGLLGPFEVVAFADELGLHKPDPALFRHALALAGAAPEDSLMVGDRLDNDVVPALGLGMSAAWVRWPRRAAKGWEPDEPEAAAYLGSLERSAARAGGPGPGPPRPWVVDQLDELEAAIAAPWP